MLLEILCMMNLLELTRQYVTAFATRDLDGIGNLLHDDFTLSDPDVADLGPKTRALAFIEDIFKANQSIDFSAKNIFVDGEHTIIYFSLKICGQDYVGVDIIRWRDDKMISLDAYLRSTVSV